ncbi:MAG: ABC transporter permease, partial [Phycisphaerae bacterium]|nr:ABC transporter permease [Phycisphaerae bacterium]
MGWMILLGSFYLLLVVALLGGNVQYVHSEVVGAIQKQHEAEAVAAGKSAKEAAPVTLGEVIRGWGDFIRRTLWNERIRYATMLSFITSTATVIVAMLVGIPTAYILSRRRFWGISIIDTILDIPIVLPPLVVGVSLLIFFQTDLGRWINRAFPGELVFKPAGIVLAQFSVACAFGIRTLKATFQQIDPRIEAVARTLGASKGQAFFRLTMPMSRDGILAAGVMTWARAIGEFGPILIFNGTMQMNTEVLPTPIFLEFQVGNLQGSLAVSMLIVLIA